CALGQSCEADIGRNDAYSIWKQRRCRVHGVIRGQSVSAHYRRNLIKNLADINSDVVVKLSEHFLPCLACAGHEPCRSRPGASIAAIPPSVLRMVLLECELKRGFRELETQHRTEADANALLR